VSGYTRSDAHHLAGHWHTRLWTGLFCGIFAFALYLRTLAPGVLGGDSGEFQFAAWLGGFVHPTGYPLYLMLAYLWSHLVPFHDPAWRINVLSAVYGALAVALIVPLVGTILEPATAGPTAPRAGLMASWLGMLAALTFACTATFWSQAVIAEVYTLNVLFVVAVLLGVLTWAGRVAQGRPAKAALMCTALVYGLSLAHHRTMILLAPALLSFGWYVGRKSRDARAGLDGLGSAALCLLLPLLLYLYIPLRAPHTPYVTLTVSPALTLHLYQSDLQGFLSYASGQAFSGEFRTPAGALGQVGFAAGRLIQEMTWPGIVLGLLGLVWLVRRAPALLLLTGISFLSLFVFNLFYGIGDIGVYYIPLYFIWALWMVLGVAAFSAAASALWARLSAARRGVAEWRRDRQPVPLLVYAFAPLLALTLPAYLLPTNYALVDQSGNTQMISGWRELLAEPVPQGTILVSNDRDEMTPLWYYQYVDGLRPDLTGLFPLIDPSPAFADVGQVVDSALASGRPVWLVKPMAGLEVKYRLEPAGSRVHVLGPAGTQPPEWAANVSYGPAVRLTGYDKAPDALSDALPANGQLVLICYWQVLQPLTEDYTSFVHLVNGRGDVIGQDDHRPGGAYYPSHLWKPGELLMDAHTLTLRSDPGPAPYRIIAGLYTQRPGGDLVHLGEPAEIGTLR
jgi:Protein of unknown function (DUF2723)